MTSRRTAVLVVLASGCAPELDFKVFDPSKVDASVDDAAMADDAADEEDLAEPEDLKGADLRGARDLAVPRDLAGARPDLKAAPDMAVVAACPPPVLLVAVENTSSKAARIDRYSLGAYGTQKKCSSLVAGGFLPQQMTAVAWIPDVGVAFAGPDGVGLIDPATDGLLWSQAINEFNPRAFDVFPLVNPLDGQQIIAAAFGTNGSGMIRVVYGFLPDGKAYKFGGQPKWEMNATTVLALGLGVRSMTPSPYDAGRVLYVNEAGSTPSAAAEADPFSATKPTDPFVLQPANARLKTIHSFAGLYGKSPLNRTVWAGESNSLGALYYFSDTAGGSRNNASGPTACQAAACTYVHVVGDPVETTGLISICETAPGAWKVLRFRTTAPTACSTILSEALPWRTTYLGLVLR